MGRFIKIKFIFLSKNSWSNFSWSFYSNTWCWHFSTRDSKHFAASPKIVLDLLETWAVKNVCGMKIILLFSMISPLLDSSYTITNIPIWSNQNILYSPESGIKRIVESAVFGAQIMFSTIWVVLKHGILFKIAICDCWKCKFAETSIFRPHFDRL